MSRQERRIIGAAAKADGKKLSEWIRSTLLAVANGDTVAALDRKVEESNPPLLSQRS